MSGHVTYAGYAPALAGLLPRADTRTPYRAGETPWASSGQPLELWQAQRGREALLEHRYAGGNDAQLLVEYPQFVPRVLDDVARAKHVVNIVEYNWEPNGVGGQMAELLKRKAREGVEVNVITDERGSFGPDSRVSRGEAELFFADMRAAGINVRVHDNGTAINPFHKHLDHRKLFDVDGVVSYVGGMGLAEKYEDWRDMMLRVEGPASAQAAAEFVASWVDLGGTVSERQKAVLAHALVAPTRVGRAGVKYLPNTPGMRDAASDDFFAAAKAAKQRFWVYTPYIGDEQICDALIDAARRGVDVRVLLPSAEAKTNGLLITVSRTFYKRLVENGVHVLEYPRMTHAKAWMSDDTVTVGSTNLTDGSFRWYAELSASVRDARLAARMASEFRRDEALAKDLTVGDLDSRKNELLGAARRATGFEF